MKSPHGIASPAGADSPMLTAAQLDDPDLLHIAVARLEEVLRETEGLADGASAGERLVESRGELRRLVVANGHRGGDDRLDPGGNQLVHLRPGGTAMREKTSFRFVCSPNSPAIPPACPAPPSSRKRPRIRMAAVVEDRQFDP